MRNPYQRDIYYKTSFEYFKSHELMLSAGWIDELDQNNGKEVNPLIELLTTPFSKLNFSKHKKNKILLTTGSFGPFHEGHVNMMEQAKIKIESEGYHVAGGYISPSHDAYVRTKKNMKLDIYDRIHIIEKTIENSDWLMLDKYESLYTPIPINFTTAIERLKAYLKHHLAIDVDIVYVFGGDNVDFSRTFIEYGEFACVSRNKAQSLDMSFMPKNKRFRIIEDSNAIVEQSSSELRNISIESKPLSAENKRYYLLRNDSSRSSELSISKDNIEDLIAILQKYTKKEVVVMDVDKQLKLAEKSISYSDTVVSLDIYFRGNVQLDLCRLFNISDIQTKPVELVFRTNSEDFFIERIIDNHIVVVDDDKASGQTMDMVKKLLLKHDIFIKKEVFLNTLFTDDLGIKNEDIHDIVDFRDFLIGASFGGLCVTLPNEKKARVPYLAPYVNLKTRAKIDTKYQKHFSLEVLEWNRRIFENNDVSLSDVCPLTQSLFKYIGFNEDTKMTSICDWHIERLKEVI